MSKVERFEDLQVWQMAHDLSVTIYSFTRDGEFSKNWGLRDQSYIADADSQKIYDKCIKLSRAIGGLRTSGLRTGGLRSSLDRSSKK